MRFLAQPADAGQLRHQFAPDGEPFTADHILRAAQRLGLKARRERVRPERLDKAVLPAIAVLDDGSFALLARADRDRVLLQDLAAGRPVIEQRAAFDARWTGELILKTTRERLVGQSRPFDVTWFNPLDRAFPEAPSRSAGRLAVPPSLRPVTPLFTQVEIDKVLVHEGWSTLDILVFGLVTITICEVLLGARVLAHTSNRIDV